MRPIAIEFQAFGSYPGHECIDFTVLAERGLFVVSGDTGTGKSTIFDAMCFALYDDMPLKDRKEIRSHHAALDAPTFVRFTFDCDGVRYVIERSPEQERPARKGGGTVMEKASVSLTRIDGNSSHSLATKSADAVARCTEIVGLEAKQFKRVILLPQGEFARFLLDGTNGREELLGQLFGGEIYDDIVERLKDRETTLRHQVGTMQSDIDHRLSNARTQARTVQEELHLESVIEVDADREVIERALEMATAPIERLFAELAQAAATADRLLAEHTEALAAAARFDQAGVHRAAVEALMAEQAEIVAGEAAAQASVRARIVVRADDESIGAVERHAIATRSLDERRHVMSREFAAIAVAVDLGDVTAIARAIDHQRRQVEDWKRAISAHDLALAGERVAAASLDALRIEQQQAVADEAAARQRAVQLQTRLDALLGDVVDVAALDARIDRAEMSVTLRSETDALVEELTAATQQCRAAVAEHASAMDRFVATQAPRLAEALRDGAPCAVCGAREHPAPARAADGEPATFEQVQRLSAACTTADQARQVIEARMAEVRWRLGDDATRRYDDLVAEVAALREQRAAAQRAEQERRALAAAIGDVNAILVAFGQSTAAREAHIDASQRELVRCQDELTRAVRGIEGIDVDRVDAVAAAVDRLTPIAGDLGRLFDDVRSAAEASRSAIERRDAALEASGFAAVATARAALLDATDESRRLQRAEQHRRDLAERMAKLEALAEQGIPVVRPDDGSLRTDAEVARAAADAMTVRHTTLRIAFDQARRELLHHDRLVGESGDLREQHLLARHAQRVCAEGGVVNMPLRRWVLAIELDRVASAANVHLQRMTGGRYIVRRRQEVRDGRKAFGLDLEVLDAHTGRTRAASSLSGGEQFQASLALALGLADVVSHGGTASGKRFEALFVDEGFGSLDPHALQDAIAALHQLRATGRMVGVITHVEDMKRDLHVGIEVKRLGDGRGSTLVVHR